MGQNREWILVAAISCLTIGACRSQPEAAQASHQTQSESSNEPQSNQLAGESAIRRDIVQLASDGYGGRNGGYPGEREAALYIAEQFRGVGLEPGGDSSGFLQVFDFHPRKPERPGQILTSQNVVGRLRAVNPIEDGQVVLVGAHYDGQGRTGQADPGRETRELGDPNDRIWNAANDNASSVAVMIEVVRLFTLGKFVNRRDIVFAAFGAEEHGMVGSYHFANSAKISVAEMLAMLNLKQIGERPGENLMTAGFATSPVWPEVVAMADRRTGRSTLLALDLPEADTDHYPFFLQGVPAMTLGHPDGPTAHTPADHADLLSYSDLIWRAELIATVLEELSGVESKPDFTVDLQRELPFAVAATTAEERAAAGLSQAASALKVAAVLDSSAAASYIHVGDFITRFQNEAIEEGFESELHRIARDRSDDGCLSMTVVSEGISSEICL
jgi:hypothetical protein